MELIKQMIREKGRIIDGRIIKVDEFLNHKIDINLMDEIGKELFNKFGDKGVTIILTIESSGIAIASFTARYFNIPFVFAKKTKSLNLQGEMYVTKVKSYTKNEEFDVLLSKKFLNKNDRVLIIDDFLAEGSACRGLIDIVEQSGATLVGIGIAIEKGFQQGGKIIRDKGIDLCSLAIVDDVIDGDIKFRE